MMDHVKASSDGMVTYFYLSKKKINHDHGSMSPLNAIFITRCFNFANFMVGTQLNAIFISFPSSKLA